MAAAKLKRLTVLLCVLLVLLVPAPCRAGSYNGEITVYVTDSGDCYHREGCTYLKSKHAVSLEDAAKSYRRCSRCDPPILGESRPDDAAPYGAAGEWESSGGSKPSGERDEQEQAFEREEEETEGPSYIGAFIVVLVALFFVYAVYWGTKYRKELKIHRARCRGELPGGVPGMPFGTIIGSDGLPRQVNSRYMWGPQYTFYVSRTGEVFHRNARCGKASLFSVHAMYLGDRRPCKICKPMRPDMSWFMPYFNAKNNIKTLPSKTKEGNRPGHDYWLRVEVGKDLGGKPIFEEITADDPQELDEKIRARREKGQK